MAKCLEVKLSDLRHHRVIQADVRQTLVALDAGVPQLGIFIAPKRKHRLVHWLGVEHLDLYQQVKVCHRQPGHGQKQLRLQPGNDILQGVFTKVRQLHKGRNAGGKLDQLFLHQFAFRLVVNEFGTPSAYLMHFNGPLSRSKNLYVLSL